MGEKTTHVAEYKKKIVQRIVDYCKKYSIIGAVNMENLPAPQLQKLKENLRGKVELFMAKRRIIKIAIEKLKADKKGIEAIEQYLKGMPALLFTNENPFSLYKILKQNKSKAPAKAGQIAPSNITVKAGPTNFLPGPVIGELGALRIKSAVENGKVSIKEDSVVAKEGDEISLELAQMLTRLGIKPMEIGLDLVATYEDGTIYTKNVLDIDEDKFMADLSKAAQSGVNLSVEAGYPTKSTIEIMITNAFRAAKAVGLEFNIIDSEIINDLLGKGENQALSVKRAGNIETRAPKPAEEAPKAEEKKKEAKPEAPKEEEKPVEEAKVEEQKQKEAEEKQEEEIKELEEGEAEKLVEEAKPEPTQEKDKLKEAEKDIEKEIKQEAKVEKETESVAEKVDNIKKEIEEEAKKIRPKKEPEGEERVKKMVNDMKKFSKGEIPTAQDLLNDNQEAKEEAKPEVKEEDSEKKEEPKPKEKTEEEKIKAKQEKENVENLAKELMRKGTLRE